jgi:hypothetical protein
VAEARRRPMAEAVSAGAPSPTAEVGPAAGGGSAGVRRPSLDGSAGEVGSGSSGAVGGGSAAGAPLHEDPP